jgi:hypothetical protein
MTASPEGSGVVVGGGAGGGQGEVGGWAGPPGPAAQGALRVVHQAANACAALLAAARAAAALGRSSCRSRRQVPVCHSPLLLRAAGQAGPGPPCPTFDCLDCQAPLGALGPLGPVGVLLRGHREDGLPALVRGGEVPAGWCVGWGGVGGWVGGAEEGGGWGRLCARLQAPPFVFWGEVKVSGAVQQLVSAGCGQLGARGSIHARLVCSAAPT